MSVEHLRPKRLIVCCDGTWFRADAGTDNLPSNVARFSRMLARQGEADGALVPQIVYYQAGVGTGNLTFMNKALQGKSIS